MTTLLAMRHLARNGANSLDVQEVAQMFSGDLSSSYQSVQLRNLDEWIRAHFVYRSELEETIRTPEYMIREYETENRFEGDCDDIATLYAAILTALHIPSRFVAIRFNGSPEFGHVFVEVWRPIVSGALTWVAVDPTVEPGTIYKEDERMVLDVL